MEWLVEVAPWDWAGGVRWGFSGLWWSVVGTTIFISGTQCLNPGLRRAEIRTWIRCMHVVCVSGAVSLVSNPWFRVLEAGCWEGCLDPVLGVGP